MKVFCILFVIITVFDHFSEVSGRARILRRQKRIVGGIAAAQPPEDDPVVYINRENRNARIVGSRDPGKGFYVFRGIRYAQPPVGSARFQRPIPIHLTGEYNASKWAPPCPQPNNDKNGTVIGNEDCLFLNVFTPALPDSGDGYPVLIWIHGGGFRRGAACQYDMRNLIRKKMVVISIQYRLGSLGFLSMGDKLLPGNNGMFDMILAVKWVKTYIKFFGGNPKRILAFGHGTGASAALMLTLSKFTRDSFSGIIAMSGSVISNFAIDKNPNSTAKDFAMRNGCPTDDAVEMVRCLREVPVESLINADSEIETVHVNGRDFVSNIADLLGSGPVVEGSDDRRGLPNFMTDTPEVFLRGGGFPKIPLLTGTMARETGGAIFGNYRDSLENVIQKDTNFLNKELVPRLQGTVPQFQNDSKPFVPEAFSKYVSFAKNNGKNVIEKVVELTGDAIFNAPAFMTVDHWSKKSQAFLYSFDHESKRNYGKDFLTGLPIVEARMPNGTTCHGDDLGFVFDRNTIFGNRIAEGIEKNEEDERVMDIFTDVIANFARTGVPSVSLDEKNPNSRLSVPFFSEDSETQFLSISSKPRILKGFRFCQMGLWTGLAKRLQSGACSIFKTTVKTVESLTSRALNVTQLKPSLNIPVAKVPEINTIGLSSNGSGTIVTDKIAKNPATNVIGDVANDGKDTKVFPKIPVKDINIFG